MNDQEDTRALLRQLREPFQPDQIKWFPGQVARDKLTGWALAYVDARLVQERLDAVVSDRWEVTYSELRLRTGSAGQERGEDGGRIKGRSPSIIVATIELYVYLPDGSWGRLRRSDGSGDSAIEAEKGALSGAFKRAASSGFGIARELYSYPRVKVALRDGKWIQESERPRLLAAATKAREAYLHNPAMADPDGPTEESPARVPEAMRQPIPSAPSGIDRDALVAAHVAKISAPSTWPEIGEALFAGRAALEAAGFRSANTVLEGTYASRVVATLRATTDPEQREAVLGFARAAKLIDPVHVQKIRAASQGII